MTNESIHAACERAVSLSSSVTEDSLRAHAFGVILAYLLNSQGGPPAHKQPEGVQRAVTARPKRKAGLKSRLEELIDDNYFSDPRSLGDVASALKTAGWNHKTKEISTRLMELTRAKRIRRNSSSDGLRYSNW